MFFPIYSHNVNTEYPSVLSNFTDFADASYSEWCSQPVHNHLEVMPHSKFSGVSGCSDAVSQGSAGSTRSTELVLGIIDSADGFSEPFLLLANLDQVISDIILCACLIVELLPM